MSGRRLKEYCIFTSRYGRKFDGVQRNLENCYEPSLQSKQRLKGRISIHPVGSNKDKSAQQDISVSGKW